MNLRYEEKIFLWMSFSILIIAIIIFLSSFSFSDFVVEFFAGVLGVSVAFYLDRIFESRQRSKISEKIIENMYYELLSNLNILKKFSIDGDSEIFDLFKNTSWEMFKSRLELDNIEILFELGDIYHRFELFNEGIKNEALGGGLSNILKRYPNFLDKLEKDINNLLSLLES